MLEVPAGSLAQSSQMKTWTIAATKGAEVKCVEFLFGYRDPLQVTQATDELNDEKDLHQCHAGNRNWLLLSPDFLCVIDGFSVTPICAYCRIFRHFTPVPRKQFSRVARFILLVWRYMDQTK